MTTTKFLGIDCVSLKNDELEVLVTQSVGPRVISVRFKGGENLLAELPDVTDELPDGKLYHIYGGHRLWHAPEDMPGSYVPDDDPVEISESGGGIIATQETEVLTGIQKSMQVSLSGQKARVKVEHTLTNQGKRPVTCAPWAITQMKPGGIAILPQSKEPTGLLPNRSLALWPYTDMNRPEVALGKEYIFVHAPMTGKFKVGFPNPRGWLAYWRAGVLFVKKATYVARAKYVDYGSSSECFCNEEFLELETLGPLVELVPGESTSHSETWEVFAVDDFQADEAGAGKLAEQLDLA